MQAFLHHKFLNVINYLRTGKMSSLQESFLSVGLFWVFYDIEAGKMPAPQTINNKR